MAIRRPIRMRRRRRVWGKRIEYDGLSLTVSQWAKRLGIQAGVLRSRLIRHPAAEAFSADFDSRTGPRGPTIEALGLELDVAGWAERLGVSKDTVTYRLSRYPPEVALSADFDALKSKVTPRPVAPKKRGHHPIRACSGPGLNGQPCGRRVVGRGLCFSHYRQSRKGEPLTLVGQKAKR